jgi:hypothetical protein
MRIGIDISQLAYAHTGVANYLEQFVHHLVKHDKKNEYILFYSSLRKDLHLPFSGQENVTVKRFKLPPTALDFLWNKLHILPIEYFIGDVDIFITSDWTEPPTKKAKKATIVYDVIVYKYPEETAETIVETQKRKLEWVKKESDMVFCISEATKHDVKELLHIPEERLAVAYPGLTL